MQAVNISGEANAVEATDVSLQLTVATTADQTTSLYVFLGGTAMGQLNGQLKAMGEHTVQRSLLITVCLHVTIVYDQHQMLQLEWQVLFTSSRTAVNAYSIM